jgi:hypothetical protein
MRRLLSLFVLACRDAGIPVLAIECDDLDGVREAEIETSSVYTEVVVRMRAGSVEWHNTAYYTECMVSNFVAKAILF